MSNKALSYAEDTLGVHVVFNECLELRSKLDECFTRLDKAHDEKRKLTESIADREADLLSDERGKHYDLSAAAFDKHFKAVAGKDTFLRAQRSLLNDALGIIQGEEYDAELVKTDIRIRVSRMDELGGYLHYLAAVKAEQSTKPILTKDKE